MILYEECVNTLNAVLANIVTKADVICAVLVGRDGQHITAQGSIKKLDTSAFSALVAGCFASTKTIALMIGEKEFSTMYQQGTHEHLHIICVGEQALLATVFDSRTTLDIVKFYSNLFAPELEQALQINN